MFIFNYYFNDFSFILNTFLIFILLYFIYLLITHIKRGLFSVFYDYIKMPQSYEFLNIELNLLLFFVFLELILFKNSVI